VHGARCSFGCACSRATNRSPNCGTAIATKPGAPSHRVCSIPSSTSPYSSRHRDVPTGAQTQYMQYIVVCHVCDLSCKFGFGVYQSVAQMKYGNCNHTGRPFTPHVLHSLFNRVLIQPSSRCSYGSTNGIYAIRSGTPLMRLI
jgi:hypothetical protein